ncbi:MAG: transposase, partial [Parasporobacterium sp.]|nr:transposase [Parasporobacterium sp.]
MDEPPILCYVGSAPQDWNWKDLLKYYRWKYGKDLKPVHRRKTCDIPENICCPRCGAPMIYLYKNNGD